MAKSPAHIRKVFEYADGTEGRSARADWVALRLETLAAPVEGEVDRQVVSTRTVRSEEYSDELNRCALGYGHSEKWGNEVAGVVAKAKAAGFTPDPKTGYATFIEELWDDLHDEFLRGEWVQQRATGERAVNTTILLEAVEAVSVESGEEFDRAAWAAKLKGDKAFAKTLAEKHAKIAAKVAEIKAQRATERAQAAIKAAAETEAMSLDDLLNG